MDLILVKVVLVVKVQHVTKVLKQKLHVIVKMNVFGKMIRVDIVMKKIHPVIQKNKLVMLIVAMHIKTKVLVMVKVNVFGTLQNPNVINQMQLVIFLNYIKISFLLNL